MQPGPPSDEISVLHPAALWGIFGFAALLVSAIVRLSPLALEPIRGGQLEPWQVALYAASIVFMLYTEAWRGFHLRLAPRVVARARALSSRQLSRYWWVAPLFCMSIVYAPRRQKIKKLGFYVAIVTLIVMVKHLPQPWRGIVDAGVCVGLAAGVLSILYFFVRAARGKMPAVSPELPN